MQDTLELEPVEAVILDEHIVTLEGDLWVARSLATLVASPPTSCPNCGASLVDEEESPGLYDTLFGALGVHRSPGRQVPILVGQE